ncbi:MAG: hypothetical protein C4290_08210 [Chloroflexota bacterium]
MGKIFDTEGGGISKGCRVMCLTCGCRDWDNDHGDPKNITYRRLLDAAEAGGVTVQEAVEHLRQGVRAILAAERSHARAK